MIMSLEFMFWQHRQSSNEISLLNFHFGFALSYDNVALINLDFVKNFLLNHEEFIDTLEATKGYFHYSHYDNKWTLDLFHHESIFKDLS